MSAFCTYMRIRLIHAKILYYAGAQDEMTTAVYLYETAVHYNTNNNKKQGFFFSFKIFRILLKRVVQTFKSRNLKVINLIVIHSRVWQEKIYKASKAFHRSILLKLYINKLHIGINIIILYAYYQPRAHMLSTMHTDTHICFIC